MQKAYADGMNAMHGEMMLGIADPVPDMAFARGMLPHHIGAVDMAKYSSNMVQMKKCVSWHKRLSMRSSLRLS